MSLKDLINGCKYKKEKEQKWKEWLDGLPLGELDEDDSDCIKYLFDVNYTPDEGEEKYNVEDMSSVCKIIHPKWHHTKCLCAKFNGVEVTLSRDRLICKSTKDYITAALRNSINTQIIDFRKNNILNPDDICPVSQKKLGKDAQVDHNIDFKSFKVIVKMFPYKKEDLKKYTYYDNNIKYYYLSEPILSEWTEFHKKHAVLRYLSKEGNQKAK